MKKLISFFAALILVCGMFLIAPVNAAVEGQYLDQAFDNTGISTGSMTIFNYGRYQTFKPTADKIVSVDAYLKNQVAGKRLNVMIKKISDGSTVSDWTASVPFVGGNGWVTVAYTAPYVAVTPETEYGMYLSITGDTTTQWMYVNSNPYSRGAANGSGINDFHFRVYGVKNAAPAGTPAGQTQTGTSATNTSGKEVQVDPSVKVPILTHVVKNGTKTEAPITKDVKLNLNDSLEAFGTSFAGAKVVLFVSDKTFNATVDKDGNWSYKFIQKDLKAGTYVVQGQAQNSEGKGSEKANLFKIKINKYQASPLMNRIDSIFADWNIYYTVIPVGTLLLLLTLLVMVARRHQTEGKGKDKKKSEEKEIKK